ncbi:MAG: DNA adenine methylase, partial [Anaerolineae bacterium]
MPECAADLERERLFEIIRQLVLWENTTNETVLQQARDEIWQSWRYTCAENADHPRARELFDRHKLPAFHDPFAGGGALPLEAQRLGLEAYASDLNPVAVLINKAMIEIPPKFAGRPPVHPGSRREEVGNRSEEVGNRRGAKGATSSLLFPISYRGAAGLAEDVRYYGKWMRDEAEKRIGHLYPKIEITAEMAQERPDLKPLVGRKLTVIAWLWARTVKSPNPAFNQVDVPLASTFMLSTKPGKEAYVEPVMVGNRSEEVGNRGGSASPISYLLSSTSYLLPPTSSPGYRFTVKVGKPKDAEAAKNGTKLARANFACVMSGAPISGDYIKAEGKAGRMGARLMAIVAEGERGRVYLPPTVEQEAIARSAKPEWKPEVTISGSTQYLGVKPYGMEQFSQLFTGRQLVLLSMLAELVYEARARVKRDAVVAGLSDDGRSLDSGGDRATAYADTVAVYLGIGVSRQSNRSATLNFWDNAGGMVQQVFARQVLPMTWDFAEGNPMSSSTGNIIGQFEYITNAMLRLPQVGYGEASQAEATTQTISVGKIVSTDPPYFDNVPYADISDFFYLWMRRSLSAVLPNLFATMTVPKTDELVAFAYRHATKKDAERFFMSGMTRAMHRLVELAHTGFPVTIYYAFRQSETESEGTASTGWETFLDAVIQAGFAIRGTWPMRTEYTSNLKTNRNALASSIVLVCRKRPADAPTATRREFVAALKAELPVALVHLQRGNIAPVDLAQAAIGPGMAVYTRYARVLDAAGRPLTVREALALINQTLDEALAEQEGDFDADTRWALAWFEGSGFAEGEFGVAETLSKAKNTSVAGMVDAGILKSSHGKVRL